MTTDDLRRAAALILHFARSDAEGFNAILREADEANRLSEMVLAVLSLVKQVSPELFTPEGQERLSSAVVMLAAQADDAE